MRNIFKKIPLLFWAVMLSVIAFLVVKENYITGFSSEQIRLFSSLLTFIGLIFVAINIQRQWKNERIKTEYLNQPDFLLTQFGSEKFKGYSPVLCPNHKECTDDHWINVKQIGNLAARDLKIALFTIDEAESNVSIDSRWMTQDRLGKNDTIQYKLPQIQIPFDFFTPEETMCFVLLLEYRSEYSNIRYKRAYSLCSSPNPDYKNSTINDWKEKIFFFDYSLDETTDSDSISIMDIIWNKGLQITRFLKINKDYCYNKWLINL